MVIAGWLGFKFAAINCSVHKPGKEYDNAKSVHQEVDEHLVISLTGPDKSSLTYSHSGQFLTMMVEWTQNIPNTKMILKKDKIYIMIIA
jgi:hypothetical protein